MRRRGKTKTTRFYIELTGDDETRWLVLAEKQGITLERLVRESVELAIMKGSSR